jgi:hypothetical protein
MGVAWRWGALHLSGRVRGDFLEDTRLALEPGACACRSKNVQMTDTVGIG